jgi:hypothetical protein
LGSADEQAASNTAFLQVWDVASGLPVGPALQGLSADRVLFRQSDTLEIEGAFDGTSASRRVWRLDPALGLSGAALIARACDTLLLGNPRRFSSDEMQDAPMLDRAVSADVCRP